MSENTWKLCSTCKKPILYGARYYVCNVSTCNKRRTGLVFCSVECWDGHLPIVRHRESWSIEKKAPLKSENWCDNITELERISETEGRKIMDQLETSKEILVVISKLKHYIRDKSGMNTSAEVMDVLSDKLRKLCDEAIEKAKQDGRKTVMARDF